MSCIPNCKVCSDENLCQTCSDKFYLMEQQNTSSSIQNNQTCKPCSNNCLTCYGPNDNQCLSCKGFLLILDGACTECIYDGVLIYQNTCQHCNQQCISCSQTIHNCDRCIDGYYLQIKKGFSCKNPCATCKGPVPEAGDCKSCITGYYLDKQTNICKVCNSSCNGCNGPNDNNCTICNKGYYLNNQTCIQCDKTCNAINAPPVIVMDILKDQANAQNAIQRDTLNDYIILLLSLHPSYTFIYLYFQIMQNFLNIPIFVIKSGLCTLCNNDGEFISQGKCLKCDPTYKKCNGLDNTNCISCPDNNYLSNNNKCTLCDNDGEFVLLDKCLKCHSTCKKCRGQNSTDCISCLNNSFLLNNNQCVECKQIGQFISNDKCIQCDQYCNKCDEIDNNKCLECVAGKFITPDNQCNSCENDGYLISLTKCLQCDLTCLKCKGETQKDCILCPQAKYLYENNQCVSCNSNGFFIKGINCLKCDSSCLTCQETNSTDCLSCSKGQYLLVSNSTCTSSCNTKNGYYISDNICIQCHKNCRSCDGELESNCLSCGLGLVFQPTLKKCDICEEEQFLNKSTNDCEYYLALSKVTNTCESNTKIKNEQDELEYIQKVGCSYLSNKPDYNCLQRFETIQSQTQILNILSITNIALVFISSFFTPFGTSLGQILIVNSQTIGNYIFASNLNSLWMNQLELKRYYAYHIATIIPIVFKQTSSQTLFSFQAFNTLISVNDFVDSYFSNCQISVFTLGVIIIITLLIFAVFFSANCRNRNITSQNSKIVQIYCYVKWNLFVHFFRLASSFLIFNAVYLLTQKSKLEKLDMIFMGISISVYIILQLYWSIKVGFKYHSISSKDLESIQSLTQKVEISDQLSRVFWILFELKKVIITVVQSIFIFTKDKQHLSCWIHVGLNALFIIYIFVKNPFLQKQFNVSVLLQEILFTILVLLLGVIIIQDSSETPYNVSSLSQNMQSINKIRTTENRTTQQIEQINETNINQMFEMLDKKQNNVIWKKI
ncbi:hypothetical protein ABPG72_003124 [Tetrahymena utriculariae]